MNSSDFEDTIDWLDSLGIEDYNTGFNARSPEDTHIEADLPIAFTTNVGEDYQETTATFIFRFKKTRKKEDIYSFGIKDLLEFPVDTLELSNSKITIYTRSGDTFDLNLNI